MTILRKFILLLIFIGILCFSVNAQPPACNPFPVGSPYRNICENVADLLCRILLLIQGIVAAIATFMMVWTGIKWMGSGETGPQEREEAKKRIIAIFTGLVLVAIATHLMNYLFGQELGTFTC